MKNKLFIVPLILIGFAAFGLTSAFTNYSLSLGDLIPYQPSYLANAVLCMVLLICALIFPLIALITENNTKILIYSIGTIILLLIVIILQMSIVIAYNVDKGLLWVMGPGDQVSSIATPTNAIITTILSSIGLVSVIGALIKSRR